jgi:DNA ligase-1
MKQQKLPIIYSKTITGATQQWEIIVEGNTFHVKEGLVGGKLTENKPTIVAGKNTGKANETSDEEQAYKEAKSKWDKKIETGYHEDINDINDESAYVEPMLAQKYVDRKDEVVFPIYGSNKIDGHRGILSKVGLYTRNGKKYTSCNHIEELLKPLFKAHPLWIIDGELYTHNYPFEKISSLIRKTKPTAEDLEESKKVIQYYIFDTIVDDKSAGFKDRFELMKKEILRLIGKNKSIVFVENTELNSHDEIDNAHDKSVQIGFEGLMIRIINSPYENKRSKNLLKYKKFFDEEYEIVDILEGKGNRGNMAGSLMVKSKDGKVFNSGIRGGEDYYKILWKNKKDFIGKLATIRYQEKSEDDIPRFPIAVNIGREDV